MKRAFTLIGGVVVLCLLGSAIVGEILGAGVLHPARLPLNNAEATEARATFVRDGAVLQDFDVPRPDGVVLRGWRIRPKTSNNNWVMLFHGQGDNRLGMVSYADFLLRAGYSVVVMDSRGQGASGGSIATYGWRERWDTKAVVGALSADETPRRIYALGESMGAAIGLQSAAVESRISGVVAEDPFSNLREVTYDYAGLQFSPWLGKTLFRPASLAALHVAEKESGFRAAEVSPERAVASRAFPVLLVCGTQDRKIPCRHAERVFRAATGRKQLWIVQGAGHTGALRTHPSEFRRRVLAFLAVPNTPENQPLY
jgi:uncharacterized protein